MFFSVFQSGPWCRVLSMNVEVQEGTDRPGSDSDGKEKKAKPVFELYLISLHYTSAFGAYSSFPASCTPHHTNIAGNAIYAWHIGFSWDAVLSHYSYKDH